jgi:YVTN family beta-propeller protein
MPYQDSVAVIDCATDALTAVLAVGLHPVAFSYDTAGNKVYCANQNGNEVVVLSADNRVAAAIPVGRSPRSMCYDPVGRKLYCANANSHDVTVIDCRQDIAVRTIPVAGSPRFLVYNPAGRKVYCASEYSQVLTVIDAVTDTVLRVVSAGRSPRVLCYNPAENKVYCANQFSHDVTVVDGRNDSVIATIPVGRLPNALFFNPVNLRVYCGHEDTDIVEAIDGTADTVARVLFAAPPPRTPLLRPRVFSPGPDEEPGPSVTYPACSLRLMPAESDSARRLDSLFRGSERYRSIIEHPGQGNGDSAAMISFLAGPRAWYRADPHPYLSKVLPNTAFYVTSACRRHELVAVRDGKMYCLKDDENHLLATCGVRFDDTEVWKCSRVISLISAARFRLDPAFDSMVQQIARYVSGLSAAPDSLPLLFSLAFDEVHIDTTPGVADAVTAEVCLSTVTGIPMYPRVTATCAVDFQRHLATGRLLPCRYVFRLPFGR